MTSLVRKFLLILLTVPLLTSCGGGGGGGGDDFIGAALVALGISPDRIDTGDRTLVTTFVSQVHENGIALKFRFPAALRYVTDSAFLTVDGQEIDLSPDYNTSADSSQYLVFFLSDGDFGRDLEGEVVFQLEASDEIAEGLIEVDADVDDPLVNNSAEFSAEEPEFAAEDEATVEVVG